MGCSGGSLISFCGENMTVAQLINILNEIGQPDATVILSKPIADCGHKIGNGQTGHITVEWSNGNVFILPLEVK